MFKSETSFRLLVPIVLLLAITSDLRAEVNFPPSETDWQNNSNSRNDPLWEISTLASQPTMDGQIQPGEWSGASSYAVYSTSTGLRLGTIYGGIYNGYVYAATDWTINDNPDPLFGGGNAWRIGTTIAPGIENSGSGNWYEVYVQENGSSDIVRAREALNETGLQLASWVDGSVFDMAAGSFFTGTNWQYEVRFGYASGPLGPGPVSTCYHWEWRQIDPLSWDGRWEPVFDGIAHVPEPVTLVLFGLGGLALLKRKR